MVILKTTAVTTLEIQKLVDLENAVLAEIIPLQQIIQPQNKRTMKDHPDQVRMEFQILSNTLNEYINHKRAVLLLIYNVCWSKDKRDAAWLLSNNFGTV